MTTEEWIEQQLESAPELSSDQLAVIRRALTNEATPGSR